MQVKTAAAEKNIHYWFAKINDPNDSTTTVETLKTMRDFILDNSVDILTFESTGYCRYSLVGGGL